MQHYSKIVLLLLVIQSIVWGQDVTPIFQTGHYSKISKIKFHPNSKNLISIGDDGKIIVWDINLGLERAEALAHQNGAFDFDFVNDSTIISLGKNNQVKTWSFPNLKLKSNFIFERDSIQSLVVIGDSLISLVGKYVHFYNLSTKVIQTTEFKSKWLFKSVDFHSERNELVVTGPKDNYAVTIKLSKPLEFKKYYVGNIHHAKYAESMLLLATTKGVLQYCNLKKGKKSNYTLHDDLNYVVNMAEQNGNIALGTAFGFTTVFNANTLKVITSIGLNGTSISSLNYSKDKRWLAIANTKGNIYLYDAEHYKLNKILKGASASIIDLKVFDNKMFIGYSDGIIRQIDLSLNQIKSNSIKLNEFQELNGINYAVLSIDTVINNIVEFTVLKTDRHHIKTSLITKAKKMKAIWKLNTNQIIISKSYFDIELSIKVNRNFKENTSFQFSAYTNKVKKYSFNKCHYEIDSTNFTFYQTHNEDTVIYPIHHKAPITGLRYLAPFDLIVSYSNDASIRFWNTKGDYLAVLYLSGQYSFFYQNAQNFYFASKEILNKIGFINHNKLFAYEQYDVYYNRPAEVMNKLPYFKKEDIRDYKKAYFKRLQKLGLSVNKLIVSDNLPEILIDYLDEYSTKKDMVKFSLSMTDLNGNIVSYSYLINGIEKQFNLQKLNSTALVEIEVALASGINQIEFYCVNDKGVKSLLKKKIVTCENNNSKPDLYLVTIGATEYAQADFNLKYAQKDAQDISKLFNKTKAYEKINTLSFFNRSFTKDRYSDVSAFLNKAKINDVVIFFYAGHGVLDEAFNYYLATYDMDFNDPQENGLPFDVMENLFESLDCRNKLMMIDACFSGEVDKTSLKKDTNAIEGIDNIQFRSMQLAAIDGNGDMGIFELSKRVFTDLRVSRGTNILSSSSGIEYALEGDKWGNGLFTYVLKKGLIDKEADLNGDKQIRILELQVYLRETVSTLSKGHQNPILRKENIKNNFVVW